MGGVTAIEWDGDETDVASSAAEALRDADSAWLAEHADDLAALAEWENWIGNVREVHVPLQSCLRPPAYR